MNEWLKMFHAIAYGFDYQDSDRQGRKVLLELKPTVHCQEYVKLATGKSQQLSILDPRPARSLNRTCLMSYQQRAEPSR